MSLYMMLVLDLQRNNADILQSSNSDAMQLLILNIISISISLRKLA